ncbi:MAG: SagB/ThcOx family dehydrogenase [Candidatus Njordarchaeia archaeon]
MVKFIEIEKLLRIKRDETPLGKKIPKPDLITKPKSTKIIKLEKPTLSPKKSLFETLCERRSYRDFKDKPLTLEALSTLLYYSVGVTGETQAYGEKPYPLRAFPTAGALNPVEVYILVRNVEGLKSGIYRYLYMSHELELLRQGDLSNDLYHACIEQDHVKQAPINIILMARIDRTYWKYGERAYKYVHLDSGHAAQNVLLVANSLGLESCVVGAFYDEEVCKLLGVDCMWEIPMECIPIGYATYADRDFKKKC